MNIDKITEEFLTQSNAIELEYSQEALEDAKQAWIMACICANDFKDVSYILGIHRRLLKRLAPTYAGKIRDVPVYIEREKRDQSHEDIDYELFLLCKSWTEHKDKLKNKSVQEKEEFIKRWHILFGHCYPFYEGNGRTGRILMNIQRLILKLPILVIHVGTEQYEYYKWFQEKVDKA